VAKVLLEWPAGKRDPGESTLACAMRELEEETGYTAAVWAYGGEIHNAAAYSSESIWIWFARGLVAGPQRLDHGEFVETVTLTEAELAALDLHDDLPDVKTLIGLHWLQQWRAGRRTLAWHSAQQAAAL
jgi:ADP-ribose pyrophosphatase